jgi:hypothetical protein
MIQRADSTSSTSWHTAAFSPDDVTDALRRRPDIHLDAYAAAHGLERLGSASAAGHFAAMPGHEDRQFNVLRGSLPGGEPGVLFHELYRWVARQPSGTSTLYGMPLRKTKWFERAVFGVVLVVAPALGDLMDWPSTEDSDQVFGIPVTTASALVPEATALGDWAIQTQPDPVAAPAGLVVSVPSISGWHATVGEWADGSIIERMLSGPVMRSMMRSARGRPFFQVAMCRGSLVLRCNGWLRDADGLSCLGGQVSALAQEIREHGLAFARPNAFTTALPEITWIPRHSGVPVGPPIDPWAQALTGFVRTHRMAFEDPFAYHLAYPELPIPGRALAVMRGRLPGTERWGRLAWHSERPETSENVGRNAVLIPARDHVLSTAKQGVRMPFGDMWISVRNGVFAAWTRRDRPGERTVPGYLGDMLGLTRAAVDIGERAGAL